VSGNAAKDSIQIVREIQARPERVFRALTEPQQLESWWGSKTTWWLEKAQVDARAGGKYRLAFRSADGNTASVEGEFEIVEPPRRIVQTWQASMYPGLTNRVEYRLEPISGGTRLTVIHSGLAGSPAALSDYEGGWIEVLLKLVTFLAAAAPMLGLTGAGEARE
jgi:uncharacterized protein YndB with AHSA1/START domain